MGAIQNARGHCCRRREQGFGFGWLCEERLSRRSDKNRIVQPGQLAEVRQNLGVLLFSLAESQARIDDDSPALHPGVPRPVHSGFQFPRDGANSVLHRRHLRPALRQPPHVVQDETGIPVRGNFGQVGIEGQSARVVKDFTPY